MTGILNFQEKKSKNQKLTMVTCYDWTMAKILARTPVDALLVGDSLAMVIDGYSSTLPATSEIMARHVSAVVRGAPNKLVIGDLPFLSYRKDLKSNMEAVELLMRAGCQALKLEGLRGNEEFIEHIVQSGVPVMGHLGLTPQSVHQLGGFRVQAREKSSADQLVEDACRLEQAGCFSVVLECVPASVAKEVSSKLRIPVIGIGAGADVDGQVLVITDMLGLQNDFKPKFLRVYLNGSELIEKAMGQYCQDVVEGQFPSPEESYSL